MAESAEELYERTRGNLRRPPLEEWVTFPFEGEIGLRELLPPLVEEPPRTGEGGRECWSCAAEDSDAIWTDANWRLGPLPEPSGMPVVVILTSRAHHDMGDLPEELQAELGPLLVRIERAVASVEGVERVHVCRWGDGGAHFHVRLVHRPPRPAAADQGHLRRDLGRHPAAAASSALAREPGDRRRGPQGVVSPTGRPAR